MTRICHGGSLGWDGNHGMGRIRGRAADGMCGRQRKQSYEVGRRCDDDDDDDGQDNSWRPVVEMKTGL